MERLRQAKLGLTGTGKQMRVFNEIYNVFIKYIEKFKPKFVGYEAIEKNRQSLYDTLMKRAIKESGIISNFKPISEEPFTNRNLLNTEFFFEVSY